MVERIDRPEAPPPYRITESKEARESPHRQPESQEEKEKRYRREAEKEWQKFGGRTIIIKPVRVPRGEIVRCVFRAVNLKSGVGTLQMDIVWKDGKTTQGALILLRSLEDFVHLKKLKPGDVVPQAIWDRGPTVEIGIPQVITSPMPQGEIIGGQRAAPQVEKKVSRSWLCTTGIMDGRTGHINWGMVALYAFLLVAIIVVIIV